MTTLASLLLQAGMLVVMVVIALHLSDIVRVLRRVTITAKDAKSPTVVAEKIGQTTGT
jgi:hypothetical protein